MASEPTRGEMPFLDHLEELRWRIFKAAIALFVGMGIAFFLIDRFDLMRLLIEPACPYLPNPDDCRLQTLGPADSFLFVFRFVILGGIILAFPVLIYQIWAFLAPALDKKERNIIVPALYGGVGFFAVGVLAAYEYALPVSLHFLSGIQSDYLVAAYTARDYMSFVTRLLLAFGLLFELPIVVLILSSFGLVTPKFLREKRRHAFVVITIVASFLSPGDIIMVTVVMMVPMVFLYEFSILLSFLVWRDKRKRGEAEDEEENTIQPPGPAEDSVEMDR